MQQNNINKIFEKIYIYIKKKEIVVKIPMHVLAINIYNRIILKIRSYIQ